MNRRGFLGGIAALIASPMVPRVVDSLPQMVPHGEGVLSRQEAWEFAPSGHMGLYVDGKKLADVVVPNLPKTIRRYKL